MLSMKRNAFILLFTFSISFGFAQDSIFKRDNDTIVAKVFEINSKEVKYKKFHFQDGPMYVEAVSEIEKIIFSNGMKQTFEKQKPETIVNEQPVYSKPIDNKIIDHRMFYVYQFRKINQKEMQYIVSGTNDKKIMSLVSEAKKARRREPIFFAAFPFVAGGIYALYESQAKNYYYNNSGYTYTYNYTHNSSERTLLVSVGSVCLAAAVACPVYSIYNKYKKMNCNSAAIKLYNQKF